MNYTGAGYVYAIRNKISGKQYVGSTIRPGLVRWWSHQSALRRGKHHSYKLQQAWDKYGETAFAYETLLVCPSSQVLEYERRLIPTGRYNVAKTPTGALARSALTKNEWLDPAIRARRMAGQKAAFAARTPEARAKICAAQTGRVMPATAVAAAAKAKWKPIFCVELQTSFLSQQFCAKHLGVLETSISNAMKHGRGKVGGYTLVKVTQN